MTKDDVAQLLAELRPSATLVVAGQWLGAYRATNEPSFTLDHRSFEAATEFGAQYNCSFRFDALVGAGIFFKKGTILSLGVGRRRSRFSNHDRPSYSSGGPG